MLRLVHSPIVESGKIGFYRLCQGKRCGNAVDGVFYGGFMYHNHKSVM